MVEINPDSPWQPPNNVTEQMANLVAEPGPATEFHVSEARTRERCFNWENILQRADIGAEMGMAFITTHLVNDQWPFSSCNGDTEFEGQS